MTLTSLDPEKLSRIVLRRSTSCFAAEAREVRENIRAAVTGARILVLGAAGFIARRTLAELLPFEPREVILVDMAENDLVELIRRLRSSSTLAAKTQLTVHLANVSEMQTWSHIARSGALDFVLNFAAVKHVRSERDSLSILTMLSTNAIAPWQGMQILRESSPTLRAFHVSTDKANDPVSIMGATKLLMEALTLSEHSQSSYARFANVAFSSGSLLESWVQRIGDGTYPAVPVDTWRYFISPKEAGDLCACAMTAPPGSAVTPSLDSSYLLELEPLLQRLIESFGARALPLESASSSHRPALNVALGAASIDIRESDKYIGYIRSSRDTDGEKRQETLLPGDQRPSDWVGTLKTLRAPTVTSSMLDFAHLVLQWSRSPSSLPSKKEMVDQLRVALPSFDPVQSGTTLDDRV